MRRSLEKQTFPQLVLVLGLEVESRDVVEDQRDIAAGGGVFEALRGDVVTVFTLGATPQSGVECVAADRLHADLDQHAAEVSHRGRLDQSSGHELEERLVTDHIKTRRRPRRAERLQQQARALRLDDCRPRILR